jgi:thioredoxin-like negative regulator of GroEL
MRMDLLKKAAGSDAIPIYEHTIEVHPNTAYLYLQLAEAYIRAGDVEAASHQQQLLELLLQKLVFCCSPSSSRRVQM